MQYLRNKKTFSNWGVIFEVEAGAVKLCHWPHCGMGPATMRRFAHWLLKRADELEKATP
jgi:hypothetical protein